MLQNKSVLTALSGGLLLVSAPAFALDTEQLRERAQRVLGSVEATPQEDVEDPRAKLGQALF